MPQTDRRAESCVGLVKRGVRSLLKEARLGPSYWALAARHWAMLRWHKAERELGLSPKALLPFGALGLRYMLNGVPGNYWVGMAQRKVANGWTKLNLHFF